MKSMRTTGTKETEETANADLMKERVKKLGRAQGESVTSVLINSGAGKNFFSNMRTAKPSETNIKKIAEYLGTTAEYIKGTTENPFPTAKNGIETASERLNRKCAELNAEGLKKLAECAALLAENPQYRKTETVISETACESAYENAGESTAENIAEIAYRAAHSSEKIPAKVDGQSKNAEKLSTAEETDENF